MTHKDAEQTSRQNTEPEVPEAPNPGEGEEPSPQAVYEETMARFAAMYEEWRMALRRIRDA